jgi:hypothetical protein
MVSTDFNQLRKTCEIAVSDSAKVMRDPVEKLPDSSLKNEWLAHIENAEKENHRRCKNLFDRGENNHS